MDHTSQTKTRIFEALSSELRRDVIRVLDAEGPLTTEELSEALSTGGVEDRVHLLSELFHEHLEVLDAAGIVVHPGEAEDAVETGENFAVAAEVLDTIAADAPTA